MGFNPYPAKVENMEKIARCQIIGISIGMQPQTLIMSIRFKRHPSTTLPNLTFEKDFKRSMYQHFEFIGEYSLTNS
jgi:hypothetical protein